MTNHGPTFSRERVYGTVLRSGSLERDRESLML